jgi:hypothetical protein
MKNALKLTYAHLYFKNFFFRLAIAPHRRKRDGGNNARTPRLKISGYAYGQNWLSAITDLWNAAISFETVQDTDKPRVYNTPID